MLKNALHMHLGYLLLFVRTCSRKWRETLIHLASVNNVPVTPVFPILSDLQKTDHIHTLLTYINTCTLTPHAEHYIATLNI